MYFIAINDYQVNCLQKKTAGKLAKRYLALDQKIKILNVLKKKKEKVASTSLKSLTLKRLRGGFQFEPLP